MAADGVTPVGCLLGGMTAAGWLLCKWLVENWRPGNNGAPRCAADGVPPVGCLLSGMAAAGWLSRLFLLPQIFYFVLMGYICLHLQDLCHTDF